jgi:hypothetical protein
VRYEAGHDDSAVNEGKPMLPVPMLYLILYVGLCWMLGHLGRGCKFGFWGNFWVGIILTPVIGLVVLLAQDHRPEKNPSKA